MQETALQKKGVQTVSVAAREAAGPLKVYSFTELRRTKGHSIVELVDLEERSSSFFFIRRNRSGAEGGWVCDSAKLHQTVEVAEDAVVCAGAVLMARVKIGKSAIVPDDTRIEEGFNVAANVKIPCGTTISHDHQLLEGITFIPRRKLVRKVKAQVDGKKLKVAGKERKGRLTEEQKKKNKRDYMRVYMRTYTPGRKKAAITAVA